MLILYYFGLCMCTLTFAQRLSRLTTHFSERIPVVKRRVTVYLKLKWLGFCFVCSFIVCSSWVLAWGQNFCVSVWTSFPKNTCQCVGAELYDYVCVRVQFQTVTVTRCTSLLLLC